VFGIRLPKGAEGDMTKAQHCWAEWYLPGYGWVVVDPADVRKAILDTIRFKEL
jgi:transglutaminase-like putative cysteine protease